MSRRSPASSPWTADKVDCLVELWHANTPIAATVKELGLSRGAVLAKLRRMDLMNKDAVIHDLTGLQFGLLTVVASGEQQAGRRPEKRWICECECGASKTISGRDLKRGHTRSCGCMRRNGALAAAAVKLKKLSKRHEIIELIKDGKTVTEICDELYIGESYVRGTAYKFGLTIAQPERLMRWTADLIKQLTDLWNEGLPTAEIGRRLGFTKSAIIGKAGRIRLTPRDPIICMGRVLTDDEINEIKLLRASGMTKHGIALQFRIDFMRVVAIVGRGRGNVVKLRTSKPRVARPKVIKSPRQISLFETVARKPLPSCLVPVVRPDPVNRLFRKPTPGVRECQFIAGNGKPWVFCSEPASHGSWCDTHYKLVCVAA